MPFFLTIGPNVLFKYNYLGAEEERMLLTLVFFDRQLISFIIFLILTCCRSTISYYHLFPVPNLLLLFLYLFLVGTGEDVIVVYFLLSARLRRGKE